jgi:hypothetical protein
MKFKFHASYTEYLSLEVEAESLEAAREIAEKSDGGDWKHIDTSDWVIEHDLTINLDTQVQRAWLIDFKAEFMRRTGITWNEDAGNTDQDALNRYFEVGRERVVEEAVSDYIEKYDLNDITL